MRKALALALMTLAAACASAPTSQPMASGQAEYSASGIDVACFREQIRGMIVVNGFAIRTDNNHQIIAGRSTRRHGTPARPGAGADDILEVRIALTMIPIGDQGLRVIVHSGYVSNPGRVFEHITPVAGDSAALADRLALLAMICKGDKHDIRWTIFPPGAPDPTGAIARRQRWETWAEHQAICYRSYAPNEARIAECAGPEPVRPE